jgi:hypothetical protein
MKNFQSRKMEHSRLWHLRRAHRNLQATLPAQVERNVDQSNPPPIDFNFGYRWNYKESLVIVATRI